MRPVFGEVVTASDVERLTSEQDERAFVRLCATLVASAAGEMVGDFAVPNWTERINVADRGVDAEYTAPTSILESGGLLGPGRNVYQVKWRRLGTRPARSVIQEFRKAVTGGLKDLVSRNGSLPDRYVLLVNLDLSRADRETLAQALRKDCPEFTDRPLIIWGAAEIAAALNSHPHVRHAFFSEGAFCTLEVAEEELRARYEAIGWVDFIGYTEPIRVIQEFIGKPTGRLLLVTGIAYSGKTRTVLEALKGQGSRIVWSSNSDLTTEDHFRSLDSPLGKAILVLDNCEGERLENFERWARSRTHLKTIIISRRGLFFPDIPLVTLPGLSEIDCDALCGQAGQYIPHVIRDWIHRLAGNNPGLILYGLAAQREIHDRPVLVLERQRPRQVVGALLRKALLENLPTDERDALHVFSVLPQVGVEGDVKEELATLSALLDRDELKVRQVIPKLAARHLLFHRGRFVEVAPELLANHLAAETLKASPNLVTKLWLRLNKSAQDRLLRRLVGLTDDQAVGVLLDEVFSENGWFRTFDDLRTQARRFRLLAEARPKAALQALERLLEGMDTSDLRALIDADLRREVVWSLETLALRTVTFPGAAELLLRLGEAENENVANSASGVFQALFHWHHPEVSAPHSERIDFLRRTALDRSPGRRRLIAQAAGRAVASGVTFLLHHGEGISLPEKPARLPTWDDVWQFHSSILEILRDFTPDPDKEVGATAFHEILEGIREMLHLSVLEDGLHDLANACFDTLGDLAGSDLSLQQRTELRSTLDMIHDDLRQRRDDAVRHGRQHSGANLAEDRLVEIRKLLADQSFESQLKRWVGPRSWGDDIADDEVASRGETELSTQEITRLAVEACRNPDVLTPALQDWLVSDEAKHPAPFFVALGEHDTEGAWCVQIIERLGLENGRWAFGWYLYGVARRNRDHAEEVLDRLGPEKAEHVRGILSAIFLLPASSKSIERLISLVERGHTSAAEAIGGIRYSGWVRSLPLDEFLTLVRGLDDGRIEASSGLVEVLAGWIHFSREMPEELQESGWLFLERSARSGNRHFAHRWDRVATSLVAKQHQRFFGLIERLANGPDGLGSSKILEELGHHGRMWKKLMELDRPGTLQSLLSAELRGPGSPFWVAWCLEHFVDPDMDEEILTGFAVDNGEKAALAVARILDAGREGFWRIAARLIAAFPDSERLMGRLDSRVGTTGVISGSFVPTWRHRLEKATPLIEHSHPKVSQWARQVVDWLEDYIRSEEREDQERFVWDYRISRRQLEGLLEKRGTPDRLWAIRRILERAPTKDVLDLLTLKDIEEGLAKVDLPQAKRKNWEAYLAHWSHRG